MNSAGDVLDGDDALVEELCLEIGACITGNIGVLATPAINLAAGPHGTLYALAKSKDDSGTQLPPKAKPAKLSSGTLKGPHNS